MLSTCRRYHIPYHRDDTKAILWYKLEKYIDLNVVPVVVTMAQDSGHEVWYTPPFHTEFHPIEHVWGIVKGEVGRQYDDETSFLDVKHRLIESFKI